MSKKSCIILIDGSNFFFKLKDLKMHNLLKFDFKEFAGMLGSEMDIKSGTYYVGRIRTDKTKKTQRLFDNQRKLLAILKKYAFKYTLGYLMKSQKDNIFHEKGVDVNIAVDIMVAAYENKCKRIILVSSDTDLIPAIKKAQEKGIEVEYIGFKHLPSKALIKTCKLHRLLDKEDLKGFIKKPAKTV